VVVVDTNILAYLLIAGDHTKEAQTLFSRDPEWKSEAFLLIEFSNILATYQRSGAINHTQAEELLSDAETHIRGLVNVPHLTALRFAHTYTVSAYDARFLATADAFSAKLVTQDTKLRAAAPGLTQSLADSLAIN